MESSIRRCILFVGTVKGVCGNSEVWSEIMYSILLPILGYWCKLWLGITRRLLYQAWEEVISWRAWVVE